MSRVHATRLASNCHVDCFLSRRRELGPRDGLHISSSEEKAENICGSYEKGERETAQEASQVGEARRNAHRCLTRSLYCVSVGLSTLILVGVDLRAS